MAEGEVSVEEHRPSRRVRVCVAIALGAVVLAGGLLRFAWLGNRPMHQDEAIHAFKFKRLAQTGRYVYDPHDFHGPTLYYATLPVYWMGGAVGWTDTGTPGPLTAPSASPSPLAPLPKTTAQLGRTFMGDGGEKPGGGGTEEERNTPYRFVPLPGDPQIQSKARTAGLQLDCPPSDRFFAFAMMRCSPNPMPSP